MITPIVAFSSLAPQEWGMLAVAFASVAYGCFVWGKSKSAKPEPVKSAALPPQSAAATPNTDAAVVTFVGLLQEKGRLIDFLMDDVTGYSDAQVGAAARVVHQGCQAVMREHLTIEPIAQESEGATVTLPAGYATGDFRLSGNVTGEPPYEGTLVHQGWKVSQVRLPRLVGLDEDGETLPHIAPAQVELS